MSASEELNDQETREWDKVTARVEKLCAATADSDLNLYIDAEESWIQKAVDDLASAMMAKYNRERATVFTTIQMYRRGRLEFFERMRETGREQSYICGVKLVRGAYLEKEQEWAEKHHLPSEVFTEKEDTDRDFDLALRFIIDNMEDFALCAATHNEASTSLLMDLMERRGLDRRDPRIQFSQLLGMGNHLTYNLAHEGYNASKYVPYGPIRFMIPYLVRRSQENASVRGTTGRELELVKKRAQPAPGSLRAGMKAKSNRARRAPEHETSKDIHLLMIVGTKEKK